MPVELLKFGVYSTRLESPSKVYIDVSKRRVAAQAHHIFVLSLVNVFGVAPVIEREVKSQTHMRSLFMIHFNITFNAEIH
jgi:hypothetical protein